MTEEGQSLRLDKWLKIARIYKSRNEATEAIEGGHVKLNGERTKPSKMVKVGDLLTIRKGAHYLEVEIRGISSKSISSKLAKELYEIKSGEKIPEEVKELVKIFDQQQKENKKEWKNTKENKKKRRELSKFKYDKF